MASIKITSLTDIGANISYTTLVPVVDLTGTPTTDKANLQIVGNVILAGAGGAHFVPAAVANAVSNAAQPNITSVGTLTSLAVNGNVTLPGGTILGEIEGANTIGFYNANATTEFLIEMGPSNAWSFNGNTGGTGFPTLTTQRGDISAGTLTGHTILFDDLTQESIITTQNGNATYINSQRLVINPGQGYGTGEGGDIYLWAGRGGDTDGNGGDVKIRGGYGMGNGPAGYLRIEGGDSAGIGQAGFIELTGGVGGNTVGGYVRITGGYGATGGGDANLVGGYATVGQGGNVNLVGGGSGDGLTSYGNVIISAGATTWTFGNDGIMTTTGNIVANNFTGIVNTVTPVNITYNSLYTLWNTSALTPLTWYKITDYQTIYDQPDFYANGLPVTNPATLTGATEPLIVFATGVNSLDNQAYSATWPEDHIEYDISFTATEINGAATKGRITMREDVDGNSIGYDFRNVLLKRYETVSGSGIYNSYKDTGFGSIDNIPTFATFCENIKVSFQNWEEAGFDDSPFVISNNVFGQYCESIITLGDFYNNTFGTGCYGDTFGHWCHNNIIGNGFANNHIANEFNNNLIGNNCTNNSIGNGFAFNIISYDFTDNTIDTDFAYNTTGGAFYSNNIGSGFTNPGITIGASFTLNTIGYNFANNIALGINFNSNRIGDNFTGNDIGDNFQGWSIQNNFANKTIATSSPGYAVFESLPTTNNNILKATNGYLQATETLTETGTGATANLVVTTGGSQVWTFSNTGTLIAPGVVKTGVYTTGTIPSAATAGAGARAFVTDADSRVFGDPYVGGSGNSIPVFSDGSSWYIG